MTQFLEYLDPAILLADRLDGAFSQELLIRNKKEEVMAFLQPLRVKDLATYEHSIRVALLARKIGKFIHLDSKALFYAGLLHDIGKAQTRLATLQKTEGWTQADDEEIMHHVMDGYRLVRDKFDFSAEIILWHHRFQPRKYPEQMPPLLRDYSEGTKILIPMYGRMLSLADTFDALHRVNDKHGGVITDGNYIKEKMLACHKDLKILVRD